MSLVPFACFIALLSFLGLREFYSMSIPHRKLEGFLASAAGALLPLALVAPERYFAVFAGLTAIVVLFGLLFLFRINDMKAVAAEASFLFAGILYVPLLLGHFVLLRDHPLGVEWLFLLLIIVMCGDTFAFYVGSSFGKRKLYPVVSPNKSIEGAFGGLAGSVAGALIARATFFPELTLTGCVATAVVLGVLGQFGDLFESLLKRSFGVKDSGSIVPGHGGILDRLDSMLFAAPAAFYCAHFMFG